MLLQHTVQPFWIDQLEQKTTLAACVCHLNLNTVSLPTCFYFPFLFTWFIYGQLALLGSDICFSSQPKAQRVRLNCSVSATRPLWSLMADTLQRKVTAELCQIHLLLCDLRWQENLPIQTTNRLQQWNNWNVVALKPDVWGTSVALLASSLRLDSHVLNMRTWKNIFILIQYAFHRLLQVQFMA